MKHPQKLILASLTVIAFCLSGCAHTRPLYQIKSSKTTVTKLTHETSSASTGLNIPAKRNHRIQFQITATQPILLNVSTRDIFVLNARGTLFEGFADIPKWNTDDNLRFAFSESKKTAKIVLKIEDMIPDRPYYEKVEKPKRTDGI